MSSSTSQIQHKVAIVGAGPGGLCLANILERNDVAYSIFDLSDKSRNQGGTLDLHPHTGQAALREAGLWAGFAEHARPDADVLKIVALKDGRVHWDSNGPDARAVTEETKFDHRPEIDRGALMDLLLGGLPPHTVRWSHKLSSVEVPAEAPDKATYSLRFADGTVETGFSLVVGADGAWSKVRLVLSSVKPSHSGFSGVELWLYDAEKRSPWLSSYVGAGSMFSFDEGRSVQSQVMGDKTIRTYAFRHAPENFITELAGKEYGIDWSKPAEAREKFISAFYSDVHPDLQRVLREGVDDLVTRDLYELPIDFQWTHAAGTEGVTLLGDAAHVMTPFAGVGVNAALTDSLELGKSIVAAAKAGKGSSAEIVAEYEKELFPRAHKFMSRTMKGKLSHFSKDGSAKYAQAMRDANDVDDEF